MNSVSKSLPYIFLLSISISCTEVVPIQEYDIIEIRDIYIEDVPGGIIDSISTEDVALSEDGSYNVLDYEDILEDTSDTINTNNDPENCGSPGYVCSEHVTPTDQNGYPSSLICVAGNCVVDVCVPGRADCNNDFSDGCETYTGSDPANCGYCGFRCEFQNALADCQFSQCSLIRCKNPYANCDMNISNGCETDTANDINNCGMCHHVCSINNAYTECRDSQCIFLGCRPGFIDNNKDLKDGCEYQCTPSNNGIEICDGKDNNCDGVIDEGCSCTEGARMSCGFNMGRCKEGYIECKNGQWDTICRDAVGPIDEECNNIDDNCNGDTDENLLRPCLGDDAYLCNSPCGTGYEYCEKGIWKRYNPPQPSEEVCDDKDNDCNGLIDDGIAKCPSDMVPVGLCLCIDRFEAARPDATESFAGTNNSYATSRAGVLPWSEVDWNTADAACRAAGKRLCTAYEWRLACQGVANYTYPYGNEYNPSTCNGSDDPNLGKVSPTGKYSDCRSTYGVFDISGNLEEWNATDYPDQKKGVRGGSYLNGTELYTKCAYDAPPVRKDFTSRSIGFRCCKTP